MRASDVFNLSFDLHQALRRIHTLGKRWKKPVAIRTGSGQSLQPTLYFLTPDYNKPSGGVRVIYRHVDILNSAGIRAFVLHHRRGFRCNWFDNDTAVMHAGGASVLQGDILVVPELCVDVLDRIGNLRYVIFNQNSHLTWKENGRVARHYTHGKGLLGVVTVSEHNRAMLDYAFGAVKTQRLHLGIDPALFHLTGEPRKNRIAYMPRRLPTDASQVLELLRGRGALDGWEIVVLDRMTEAEIAAQLKTTKIFLAFAYQEGFGLPPAEAMACGNYAIGYYGFAGREYFRPDFSCAVEAGDIVSFARAVEDVLARERIKPGWCQAKGAKASAFIASEYSPERERDDVLRIYRAFLQAT